MDIDRHPHRSTSSGSTTNTTSELFICFTSRLSSSSMKSILSPGRAREPSQISLSASLSRRLKTNGSIKGGQSPMFPKKRGAGFENVEPSSPKVTCIGQVRVKTKKQGKKMRSRSKRRAGGGGGDASFRRVDQNKNPNQDNTTSTTNHVNPECLPHRNQRWVHLPVTICEALRTFGAELNCFIPCRSNCMKEKEEGEKDEGSRGGSCGAVFARWLLAVEEGEGEGKGREIELVVGEEDRVESSSSNAEMMMRRSQRRHVFEEIEFKEEMFESKNVKPEEDEEGRVSICIPPKNALLLMRCRSDPVKMAALANKFWEAPEVEEREEAEEGKLNIEHEKECKESRESEECEKLVSCVGVEDEETPEIADTALVVDGVEGDEEENPEGNQEISEAAVEEVNFEKQEVEAETEQNNPEPVEESQVTEIFADLENLQNEENVPILVQEREEDNIAEIEPEIHRADKNVVDSSVEIDAIVVPISSSGEEQVAEELQDHELEPEQHQSVAAAEEAEEETEYTEKTCQEEEKLMTLQSSETEHPATQEDEVGCGPKEELVKRESTASVLPDCLLLMMCEPKLSMEVSKETWVCSTDFIRSLPVHSRLVNKTNGGDKAKNKVNKTDGRDESKKKVIIDSNPVPVKQLQQPSRSSCSYPSASVAYRAGVTSSSMANSIERKLVGGKVYEPFALKRCKSEPRRSAAKLAAPEACFWKNRKLEPHRQTATLGVGAAGVGF